MTSGGDREDDGRNRGGINGLAAASALPRNWLMQGFGACKYVSTALIYLASATERADEQMLPSLYFFLGRSFNAPPSRIGAMTMARAAVQALASPIGGFAGNRYNRAEVVAVGCILWSIMTAFIGISSSLLMATCFSALNGIGLALVIPSCQSLIADMYSARVRGRAFGLLMMVGGLGGMSGGFLGTTLGDVRPFGFEGWRFVFLVVAAFSLLVGCGVLFGVEDPGKKGTDDEEGGEERWGEDRMQLLGGGARNSASIFHKDVERAEGATMWQATRRVLRVPTFQVIVAQGVVGTMPWYCLGYLTLWFQEVGFRDWQAALLVAAFQGANSLGVLLGGAVGDAAATRMPSYGRIICAQFSVLSGIPLTWILVRGLPQGAEVAPEAFISYMVVLLLMGLLSSWCGACCNCPVMADIVPANLRSLIFAYDRCLEGGVAALITPFVGLLAEHSFGYHIPDGEAPVGGSKANLENASALGNALLVTLMIPWSACLTFYTLLYYTYPKDKARMYRGIGEG